MSTTPNPKTTKGTRGKKTQSAELPAPKVEPVVVVPPPTPVPAPVEHVNETSEAKPATKRVQSNTLMNTYIAVPRVRTYFINALNGLIDTSSAEVRDKVKSYEHAKAVLDTNKIKKVTETTAEDGSVVKTVKELPATPEDVEVAKDVVNRLHKEYDVLVAQKKAYSKSKSRFSGNAPAALSIICDEFAKQLVYHAMDNTILDRKKTVQVKHLHSCKSSSSLDDLFKSGVCDLPLYPLLRNLHSFVENDKKFVSERIKTELQSRVSDAVSKREKELYKQHNIKKQNVEPEPAETKPAVAHDKSSDDNDDNVGKTTFKHYIINVCKDAQSNPKYTGIKTSSEFKSYISDLVIELISRLAPLVKLTSNVLKNKTITETSILDAVKILLIDGHKSVDKLSLDQVKLSIPDPVALDKAVKNFKENGVKYNEKELPHVESVGWEVTFTQEYPTSPYETLEKLVHKKLEAFVN